MPDVTQDAASVLANDPETDAPNHEADGPGGIASTNNVANNVAPSSLPAQQPVQQGPTPDQQAAMADIAHHATVGKSVRAIFNSLNNSTDDGGGAKPGGFFRNLLLGALIGGAAGGGGKDADGKERDTGAGGFLGGLSRGGAAVIQDQRAQQQAQLENRSKQQQNDRANQSSADEHTLHQAMVAHENLQTSDLLHNMHAADEKAVRDHNAASRAYQKSLIDSGAIPAQISINGKLVDSTDGNSFVAAYTKDPSIATAPAGYARHFISTADLSELHFDGDHWNDDSDNPVNIGKNMSIRFFDQPTSTFSTPSLIKGSQINAARRQKIVDDSKNYSVSPDAMSGLYTIGAKEAAEKARSNNQRSLTDQRNKNAKQFTQIESKKTAALANAEHEYWQSINKGNDSNNALSELNAAKQAAQNGYEDELKSAGASVQHFDYGAANAPQANPPRNNPSSRVTVGQTVRLKNGDQVQVTKVNPNGTFEYSH